MDANKRILELMAQRNWSAYRLVKETNLSHSLIYNMVRRNNRRPLTPSHGYPRHLGLVCSSFLQRMMIPLPFPESMPSY